jgi:uncharacterized damage-inducible protein DinB
MMLMETSLIAHFRMLARYNTVVNDRIYATCHGLTDEEYRKERAGSFRSIHRTLNHLLLGDRIWIARFTGGGVTPALDTVLYDDLPALQAAREAEDRRIENFIAGLTGAFLARELRYLNNAGLPFSDPAPVALAHFFNHQTHHRGQVHVMLAEAGVVPVSLDLHRAIRPHPLQAGAQ